jgi:hypothetical protein
MPHNLKSKEEATGRAENFARRLKQTMGTESDPEMVTPQTSTIEELPYGDIFPIVNNMNQTNMFPGGRRKGGGQRQNGDDNQG